MTDWESMRDFALVLIQRAKLNTTDDIIDQRIAIVHLDHATELLMKSFLIKKGYVVEYVDKKYFEKGLKKTEIKEKTHTIDYGDCLEIIKKEGILLNAQTLIHIQALRKLRNEIQHRATNIPFDKKEKIREFYPSVRTLWEKMFPDQTFPAEFL